MLNTEEDLDKEVERIGTLLCQKITEHKESKRTLDPLDGEV